MKIDWKVAGVSAAIFTGAFVVYLSTLAPGITWRNYGSDSAEFSTAVQVMGVAHPTGYPTFLILYKLFAVVFPFGDLAHRLSVLSALLAAGAAVLVFFGGRTLLRLLDPEAGSRPLAFILAPLVAALAFAFAPLVWSQATITEVYALDAFLVAAVLLFLLRSRLARQSRPAGRRWDWDLIAAAALLGLGLGNHVTILALLPVGIVLTLTGKNRPPARHLVVAGLALLVALGVYVYLPVRAATDPPVNWGRPANLSGFFWEISGAAYRSYLFAVGPRLAIGRLSALSTLLFQQFNALGLILSLIGAALIFTRDRLLFLTMLFFMAAVIAYAVRYLPSDSLVYVIPVLLVLTLWMSVGLYFLMDLLAVRVATPKQGGAAKALPALAGVAALLVVPALTLALNYSDQNIRNDRSAIEYYQEALAAVEPNALILVQGDQHVFSLWYGRFVQQPESKVAVVATELAQFDWYYNSLARTFPGLVTPPGRDVFERNKLLVEQNRPLRPIYLTSEGVYPFDQFAMEKAPLPHGALYRLK